MYCTVKAVVVDTVHSWPSSAQKNWSVFDSVAIGNRERHVRKASHRGSKQQ